MSILSPIPLREKNRMTALADETLQRLYLAYGSNMCSVRLRQRAPSARCVGAALLPGWELRFHERSQDGSGKCNIARSENPGAVVHGVVFELDPAEKRALTTPRCGVSGIAARTCGSTSASDGRPPSPTSHRLPSWTIRCFPTAGYWNFVVAGAREHGLPESYLAELLAIEVRADPDSHRESANRSLLDLQPASPQPRAD